MSEAVRIQNVKKLLKSSYSGPVAHAYISSRLKASNITLHLAVNSPKLTDILYVMVLDQVGQSSVRLLVPIELDLLLGSHVIQGLKPPKLVGDLSCFKTVVAGKKLVAGCFKVHVEELQLVVKLEDVSIGFVIAGDLCSDLPVVQLGRGSQDDVEG